MSDNRSSHTHSLLAAFFALLILIEIVLGLVRRWPALLARRSRSTEACEHSVG
ncbi:MAG: hypothetical protein JXP73_13430 [Deltaproteobacteria bacterium]|nr:hypothetical protein [Deltaproteobacteria bacterium]